MRLQTVCLQCHQHIQRKTLPLVATVCGDACSVLIHLLPGLALFAQRHFPPPEAASRMRWLSLPQYTGEHDGSATFWWFLVAPFIFYATWQTVYWFIVQVAMLCHLKAMANTALQSTVWILPCSPCLTYAVYLFQQAQLCHVLQSCIS